MSADKKDRMRMRVLFAEGIAKEVLAKAIADEVNGTLTPGICADEKFIDSLIDRIYNVSDQFINRQQKVVDEYQLAEQPRVMPGIIAPPNIQRG
jgi:hypothetical protein